MTSRVSISWISTEKACKNLEDEIPAGTSFRSVVDTTKSIWNSKVLSKVTTSATNPESLQLLYTSLYYMHLIPTNQTGENPGWKSSEPYWQDFFTFWVSSLVQSLIYLQYLTIAGHFPLQYCSVACPSARGV